MKAVPFYFKKNVLMMLDQRELPNKEKWIACKTSECIFVAIRDMAVRGAPAIGVAGGYGLYLGMKNFKGSPKAFQSKLKKQAEYLKSSRPTGVNLRNVIDAIVSSLKKQKNKTTKELIAALRQESIQYHAEDLELCRSIGKHGARLFKNGETILTHCNAGGLATTGYGTALGVIYACFENKKKVKVFADETRPLLQGARLTAWELKKNKVPVTVLCDNAAASLMQAKKIDRIIVGADRIASNGDAANKIGTYNLAVLAKAHKVPFYIAAPSTTFDFKIKSGAQIPIEERHDDEVTKGMGKRTAPKKVKAANPAFDVTPNHLITAIITEHGVLRAPYSKSFKKVKNA